LPNEAYCMQNGKEKENEEWKIRTDENGHAE
jgi:hypothetical protein